MIRINKNKLLAGGFCFSLPDGFFIDPCPAGIYEDGMSFYSSDKSYYLELYAHRYDESAYTHLSNYITDNDFAIIEPVRNITINDVVGCSAIYHSERYSYYEIILETPDSSEEFNVFTVRCTIEGVDSKSISELTHSETLNAFLNSIFPIQ